MIHRSDSLRDDDWDAFLDGNAGGAFQQSGRWAEAKAGEGWNVERVRMTGAGGIAGGFQILWKHVARGRIGYLSRGPVVAERAVSRAPELVGALLATVDKLKLMALVAQCPEGGDAVDGLLVGAGFLPNRIESIITATWVTPLQEGMGAVEARMGRRTRGIVRQATRRGVRVENGGREDLGVFFELMVASCGRQGAVPSPGTRQRLENYWDAFSEGGHVRLGLARIGDKVISALISLHFGGRLTLWKKGSDPGFSRLHSMEPLYRDALAWGCAKGADIGDYGSLKRETAEALLAGKGVTEAMRCSRDFYNMRFGGHPVLLPEARVWIRNPMLRSLYRFGACGALGSRLLRSRYRC